MKRSSTIFLRIALLAVGAGVAALCLVGLPLLWNEVDTEFPRYAYAVYAVFIAVYCAAVPFFMGLYKGWCLLGMIDKGEAFSLKAATTLKFVAICAAAVSVVYLVSLPFFYIWADNDDAPGLMVIGLVLTGAPLVVSVFGGVLQRLFSEAVALKSENDLTV